MAKKPKRVMLLLDKSREADRNFIAGIVSFARQHANWTFYRPTQLYAGVESILPFRSRLVAADRELTAGNRSTAIKTLLVHWKADGFIGYIPNRQQVKFILPKGLPSVVVPVAEPIPGLCNLLDGGGKTGAVCVEYFLGRGFVNLAFCGYPDFYWGNARLEGFRQAARLAGRDVLVYQHPKSRTARLWENEQIHLGKWLTALPKPVGLMACNDDRAEQVLEVCGTVGLKVPDQVSVLGVDNDPTICQLTAPPLSSVAVNQAKCGYQAAATLHRLMSKKTKAACPDILQKPMHVASRASTDFMAVKDPALAKALRFINENADHQISVEDVVRKVTVARCILYRQFRDTLKRSILDQIRVERTKRVCAMLSQTDMTATQIAYKLDFNSPEHLSRYFQKEMGMTISEYRQNRNKIV